MYKRQARTVPLEESVTDAVAQGLSVSKAESLRGIWSPRFNAVRRALRGDPPARVEAMRAQLKRSPLKMGENANLFQSAFQAIPSYSRLTYLVERITTIIASVPTLTFCSVFLRLYGT